MSKLTIVDTFETSKGGIVQITKEPSIVPGIHFWYRASWIPDFLMAFDLDVFAASIYDAIQKVMDWDPKIKRVHDFGDWVLFSRKERTGELVVNLVRDWECVTPIKAKDVPQGATLVGHALDFFRFWKGEKAVDMVRGVLK